MSTYTEKIFSNVSFYDICFDKNYGWFCDAYTNTLYNLDIFTNTISVRAIIPIYKNFQYGFIAKWKDILILAPRSAEKIMIYYTEDDIFAEIDLDLDRMGEREIFNLFSGVQIFDDNAFLIPGRYPAIVRLNLHTFELEYFDLWYEQIKSKIKDFDERKVLFARCNCAIEGKILLPCWQGNMIVEFQTKTGKSRIVEFQGFKEGLSGMYVKGQELILASKSSHTIFRCSLSGNVLKRIELQGLGETGISFLIEYNGKAVVVPVYGDKILIWDFDIHRCSRMLKIAEEEKEDSYVGSFFPNVNILSCIKDNHGNLWAYSAYDNLILKIHLDTWKIERINISLSEKDQKRKVFCYMQTVCEIWEENRLISISDFCSYIKSSDKICREQNINENTVGKSILKIISEGESHVKL